MNKNQPQNNLNQFKEDNSQEYYDTSSVKRVHRVTTIVPNDPPMKPKDSVLETIAEVEIETELLPSTPEDTKDPVSAMEAWGTAVTTRDAGSLGDGEKEKAGDQKEQLQTKPHVCPRPITPQGTKKAELRFNLPLEPLRNDPGIPPPAIPPRIPLKDINKSQPQNNLNAQEHFDTSSMKGVHCVVASISNNPPMKPKDCVLETIAEMEIETELSLSTPEESKDPGSAMEAEGAAVTAGNAGSLGDGEKKRTSDQKEQLQTKTHVCPRSIIPRGTKKTELRFNLPPEPLRSDPGIPPPAIPPRSPRVPLPPSNKDGPEQLWGRS